MRLVAARHGNATALAAWRSKHVYEPVAEFGEAWWLLLTLFSIAAIVLCLTANVGSIMALCRLKTLHRSVSNLYVLSLSLADLLLGLLVMLPMGFYKLFVGKWSLGERLCDGWQLGDLVLSSASLYSTLAIAVDRWYNLEQPLRIFRRDRQLAKRLVLSIWLLPIVSWTLLYGLLTNFGHRRPDAEYSDDSGICDFQWEPKWLVLLCALPLIYLPAFLLLATFGRISFVIRRHLRFLRENSGHKSMWTGLPTSEGNRNASESKKMFLNVPRRNSNIPRSASGQGSSTLGAGDRLLPPSRSIAFGSDGALDRSSTTFGSPRHRSNVSETTTVQTVHSRTPSNRSATAHQYPGSPSATMSPPKQITLTTVTDNGITHKSETVERVQFGSHLEVPSSYGSIGETSPQRPSRSSRFSIVALPSVNLTDLLYKDGGANLRQQMKAAKAVALVSCCFLFCWLPFLLLWPVRLLCEGACVDDRVYVTAIWLNYFCSTINPLIYTLASPRARLSLKSYFGTSQEQQRMFSAMKSITLL